MLSKFSKFPLKRLLFITVRDNTQKSKWIRIGKINDWIRRYSDCYYIVRGTEGGIHFHMLAGIRVGAILRFPKGIHFCVRLLGKKPQWDPDLARMDREARDFSTMIREETFEALSEQCLEPWQQESLQEICNAIHAHFRRQRARTKRAVAKNRKEQEISRVLNYLQKNLDEPREDLVAEYTDYIYKH